ncbi:MAG: hypothetical protein M3M99_03945 [Actinomycetota bacterium]|nr:hypothetical protein [Actinomycetota bacterium]
MYTKGNHQDQNSITMRLACPRDEAELRELAERDSAMLPRGELLLAVADGKIGAAMSVNDGVFVADPFHPSAELVRLLSARIEQLRGRRGKGLRARLGRALGGRGKRGLSPQPAGTIRALD